MKKLISFILAITLALSMVAAMAEEEEFSVRNGIKFGMTPDEVKAIEAELGSPLKSEDSDPVYKGTDYTLDYWYVPVAGYEGTAIYYYFKDNALFEIVYHFNANSELSTTKDGALKIARDIYQGLADKYGEADEDGSGIYYDVPSYEFRRALTAPYDLEIAAYSEWLKKIKDGYLTIDLFVRGDGYPKIDRYTTTLAYHKSTTEEVESKIESEKQAEEEKQKQRNSDL